MCNHDSIPSLTPAKYIRANRAAADLRSNPDATIGDLFRVSDKLNICAGTIMRMWEAK